MNAKQETKLLENYILLGKLIEMSRVNRVQKLLSKEETFRLLRAIEPLVKTVSAAEEQEIVDQLLVRCAREILAEVEEEEDHPSYH